MPRDLPLGNGSVFVAFDFDGYIREFHFPHVGEENHTLGQPFRFGILVDGKFSWLKANIRTYIADTHITEILFEVDSLKIWCNDLVDIEENIYLRKITIEGQEKEVRLFLAQDFSIYGNAIGDTAAYRPENNSLLHYKAERYFLINIFANNKVGIDHFATGNKQLDSDHGTWKDAEDGILSQNPIAQGSVDSVIEIPLTVKDREVCYYWICAGKNWEEVKNLNLVVKKKTPEVLFKRTYDYWKFWMNKGDRKGLSEKILELYRRSLCICKVHMNTCGSIIASNDSDSISFNRDTYSYMWPRDGAFIANALDMAGFKTESFYQFCSTCLEKGGYFLHKYTPTGSVASSWHPWVKERSHLPIQEDETALVIWALWNHYTIFKDLDFIRSLYTPMIKKCADFMMNYRDLKTGLPLPSYDLWEERQGVFTYTTSTVIGGLNAAANFAEIFGEKELAEEYRAGAQKMRDGMDQYLYLPEKKRFARSIGDDSLDASLFATFAFGAYLPDDEKVKNTMEQVIDTLGFTRYVNDSYYKQNEKGNPWFICALWIAQYFIAIGEKEKAENILEWVAGHALMSGVISEQINEKTGAPISVSPLTWSHGAYVATVEQFLRSRPTIN